MRILNKSALLLALFFIAIGEGVFFAFSLIVSFFLSIWHAVISLGHILASFLLKGLPTRRPHRQSLQKPLYIPVWIKIRYFSIGIIFCFLFIGIPLLLFSLFTLLPNPKNLQESAPQTTKILDRNHKLLYALYASQDRTIVPLSQIPKSLKDATVAIEDKNFYKNPGFDIIAMFRALLSDFSHKNIQGGSTITQQLVKSGLLTSERSIKRKVEEIMLSLWTERIYSKDHILELYLNQVPYGGTAWGVEAASNLYFGKDVKELDLAESSFLAGLPQAPSSYSPFSGEFWKNRQKEVLSRMKELGFITREQEDQALGEKLIFIPPQTALHAPHFVMYIKDLLAQKYGLPLVEKGGLTVVTTLDLSTQDMAQQIVTQEVSKDSYLHLSNGAALVTNPMNGDILALVGSADYHNSDWGNVNIATSLRQPGSSIKVVTYAAALGKGNTSATSIDDSPVSYPGLVVPYSPVNYDGQFHGQVTLRQALANSFNIPAVKLLNSVGIDAFVTTGRAMGISHLQNPDQYGLSVTLGSADVTMLDMATAYGTLASGGKRIAIDPILKVIDAHGSVLEEKNPSTGSGHGEQVLDPSIPFILSDILSDNTARSWEFGSNSPLKIDGHFVSVKTGTSDSKRDNWTIGYTPNFVVTVWVGNNDNSPMSQDLASGITGAAPIWHAVMSNLLGSTKDPDRVLPGNVIAKSCFGHTEYFVKGTENSVNCNYSIPTWTPTPKTQQN